MYKMRQPPSTLAAPLGPVMTNTSREVLRGGLNKDGEDSAKLGRTHQQSWGGLSEDGEDSEKMGRTQQK